MDRTSRDRPPSARHTSRLSSRLSSSHSRNGPRAPQDNHSNSSLKSSRENRRQSKRTTRSNSDTSHSRRNSNGSKKTQPAERSGSGGNFARWTITVVMFLAIADLIVLWTSIDATIGDQNGDMPHQTGPEVGLHQLTEKRTTDIQFQLMNDIARKQQEQAKQEHEQAKQQRPKKRRTRSESDIRRIDEERRRRYVPIDKVKNVAKVNKVKNTDTFGVNEHIVKILTAANIKLDEELASQLPTWDDIVSMYGDKPIIHGLETCQTYRDTVVPADRMLGPAGIFNTGTNLLFELMKANCNIKEARTSTTHREPHRNGMRFQPPWGKHNPPSNYRDQHVAKFWGEGINQTAFFPVVMIKDFYHWAGSQCRHSYTTWWDHDEDRCPNLVNAYNHPSRTAVRFGRGTQYYDSILDLWNKYYQEWEEQTFPHLTTRYEDLLFHGEEVTKIACDCVGGAFTTNFAYVEGSAKENGLPIHNGANGLIKALLQYGKSANRLSGFTDRDRLYASKTLDSDLVNRYGYSAPPLPT
mmetsp:Transcript_31974/g.54091  ORF Transcript_31974/g.54091 Transcript_31974/m.54091 type:complete len:524 (+) Transcript_31974:161-1732(+)